MARKPRRKVPTGFFSVEVPQPAIAEAIKAVLSAVGKVDSDSDDGSTCCCCREELVNWDDDEALDFGMCQNRNCRNFKMRSQLRKLVNAAGLDYEEIVDDERRDGLKNKKPRKKSNDGSREF